MTPTLLSLIHGIGRLYVGDALMQYVRALLAASEPLKALTVLAPENLPPQVDQQRVAVFRDALRASIAHIADFTSFERRHPRCPEPLLGSTGKLVLPRCQTTRQVVHDYCAQTQRPVRLLSMGCEEGTLEAQLLAENENLHVTLTEIYDDVFQLGVLLAERYPGRVDVHRVRDWFDWTTAKTAHTYDLVVCLEVLEHVPDPEATVWHATHDVLRPGGLLLVSTPSAYAWIEETQIGHNGHAGGDPAGWGNTVPFRWHIHQLSPERLAQALHAAGLSDVSVTYLCDATLYAMGQLQSV